MSTDDSTTPTTYGDDLNGFVTLVIDKLHQAHNAIAEVGRLIAEGIDRFGTEFLDHMRFRTGISNVSIRKLERIGRGTMDHRLYTLQCIGLQRMSIADQRAVLDHGVEVVTATGDILMVSYENLTTAMAHQVFADDHIRDPGEQRAWLESQRLEAEIARPSSQAAQEPYRIDRRQKRLRVLVAGMEFTTKLLRHLADMIDGKED